ncbi:hypothetical protein ACN4EK_05595 [Pantanalinema rosaneae CENA516]|uniref:hypothetical protein n=1 Tax=Pantanalinema rosaneae TaxID=1620701 RepID=UPI003D6FA52F
MTIAVRAWLTAIAALLGIAIAPAAAIEVYQDQQGEIYLSGFQPKELVSVAYQELPNQITTRSSGSCNIVRLPDRGFYPWDQVQILDGDTPLLTIPRGSQLPQTTSTQFCRGTQKNEALPWQSLGNGIYGLQIFGRAIVLAGLPFKPLTAQDQQPKLRLKAADTCGILKLTETPTFPRDRLGNFYFYSTTTIPAPSGTFNRTTLPVRNAPDLCRKGVSYKPCAAIDATCTAAGSGYAGDGSSHSNSHSGGSSNTTGGGTSVITYPEFFTVNGDLWYRGNPNTTYGADDGEVWRSATANACGDVNLGWWAWNVDLYRLGSPNVLVKHTPEFGTAPDRSAPSCP